MEMTVFAAVEVEAIVLLRLSGHTSALSDGNEFRDGNQALQMRGVSHFKRQATHSTNW